MEQTANALPPVTLGQYKGLPVTRRVRPVTEAAVASELKSLARRHAPFCATSAPAARGMRVTLDFEGFLDGAPIPDSRMEQVTVTLGTAQLMPAAEQAVYGPLIVKMLAAAGYKVEETLLLPDEAAALKAQLIRLADGRQVNLILTTGGTGFSPRDITPEATLAVADRNAPGIAEAMRYHSLSITPRGMLSRAASVLRGKTLIVNLPGSPKAVQENLEYILPSLEHGLRIAAGLDGECARH